jgi:hypothetical protein
MCAVLPWIIFTIGFLSVASQQTAPFTYEVFFDIDCKVSGGQTPASYFCDTIFNNDNKVFLDCEPLASNASLYQPVTYNCSNGCASLKQPTNCTRFPQAQWPINGACTPAFNNLSLAAIYRCPGPSPATPTPPTPPSATPTPIATATSLPVNPAQQTDAQCQPMGFSLFATIALFKLRDSEGGIPV